MATSEIRLSEAIRLGAMLKPQGGAGTGHRGLSVSCAFGAALDTDQSVETVSHGWPWLATLRVPCPVCHGEWNYGVIPHLNNTHHWTREAIADWVEPIEPQPAVVRERDAVEA